MMTILALTLLTFAGSLFGIMAIGPVLVSTDPRDDAAGKVLALDHRRAGSVAQEDRPAA